MRTALVTILTFAALGCGGPAADAPAAPATFAVTRTASGGPVTLSVRISKDEVGLAQTIVLEEEVAAEPGFVAELPEFLPEEFEGMGVTDIGEAPVEHRAGGTVRKRHLTLEPERSGTLTIPSREAWFSREGNETESSVATEPIEIRVSPIENAASIALPPSRPALREEDVAPPGGLSPWWAVPVGLAAAAAAVLVLRRRRKPAPPARPAHEIAFESLRRLVALDLIAKGEVERFFVTLSAILREYVERRFGVRAPERTTKEFLAECAEHPRLAGYRAELGDFLTVADRVKFARHAPEEADIQRAFDRAKSFVAQTAEEARDA